MLDTSYAEMVRRWAGRDFAVLALGVWLLASPATIGYHDVWMFWSDIVTGSVIVALAIAVLSTPRLDVLRWAIGAAGMWLLFAPLVFWTPDPGAYVTDTLVGSMAIAFSVVIPARPGRRAYAVMTAPGPEVPPGWSYNPSDWWQRAPIVGMALLGFFLSRYLAAFQLGHIGLPWDPFFGDGTRRVLDSDVSKAWPISDAGLGAVSYMLEALTGLMGARNRWRTMPWIVVIFGVLVVPVGVVSIVLVVLQPIAVNAWCTLCLVTAAAMLVMIAPAADEVIATGQFLFRARREGQPLWRTFWVGGTLPAGSTSEAPSAGTHRSSARRIAAAFDLNSVPWNLVVTAALGVWLMASVPFFATTGAAADNAHLVGALIVTFAVIAFGEVVRPVRLLNILVGVWLVVAGWSTVGGTAASRWNDAGVGAAAAALSVRRGAVHERFAGWNRVLV
jgi:hypothetical protein